MRPLTPSRARARLRRPSTHLPALALLLAMAAARGVAAPPVVETTSAPVVEPDLPAISTVDPRLLNTLAVASSLLTLGGVVFLAWQGRRQGRLLDELNSTYKAISRRLDQVGELKDKLAHGLDGLRSELDPATTMRPIQDLLQRVIRGQAHRGPDPAHTAALDHQRKDLEEREKDLNQRESALRARERSSEVERQHQKAALDEDRYGLNQEKSDFERERSVLLRDRFEHDRRVQDHHAEREEWARERDRVRGEAEQRLAEAAEVKAKAEAALKEVDEREREAYKMHAAAAADRQKAEDERRAAAADRQEAEVVRETAAEDRGKVESICEYFWPSIFRGDGALAGWRSRIEEKGSRPDSAAPLLINALHRYALIRAAGDRADGEDMARSLQEIGRQAYLFWAEENADPEQQAGLAEDWARAFEAELGPHFKVRVVRPGQPKDNTWMTYKYGGSSQVARVESWCVQGPNSTLRANVH